jgi:sRNA-binding carbon storage regulator CsrA
MLVLTRKEGESILISLADNADPDMTLGELFANGPVELYIKNISGKQVGLSFKAPRELLILRNELEQGELT